MGTCFSVTLRNEEFDATKREKTKKYFFALERLIWPFGPAKAKSSRRVLRTTSAGLGDEIVSLFKTQS